MMFQAPPSQPDSNVPPDLLLWRRVAGFAPWWAWIIAMGVIVAAVLPFWLFATPAPYYDYHGDLYRGWPEVYGLDQGDVGGDEWGPFVTYLRPSRLAWDTLLGVVSGLPLAVLVVWGTHLLRRGNGDRPNQVLQRTGRADVLCFFPLGVHCVLQSFGNTVGVPSLWV